MLFPVATLILTIPLLLALSRTKDELRATIERPRAAERTDFYPLIGDVDRLVNHVVSAPDLVKRARVTVDGAECTVAAAGSASTRAPGPE